MERRAAVAERDDERGDDLVVVFASENEFKANLVKSFLEGNGVECALWSPGIYYETPENFRVAVAPRNRQTAVELIRSAEAGEAAVLEDSEWSTGFADAQDDEWSEDEDLVEDDDWADDDELVDEPFDSAVDDPVVGDMGAAVPSPFEADIGTARRLGAVGVASGLVALALSVATIDDAWAQVAPLVLAALGMGLSLSARQRQTDPPGRALSTAGLIVGAIALVVGLQPLIS